MTTHGNQHVRIANTNWNDSVAHDGFATVEGVFLFEEMESLISCTEALEFSAGTRNLLSLDWAIELASDQRIRNLVEPILGVHAIPVRGILFDKRPGSNWNLGWHQDTKIAVRHHLPELEQEGYTSWSVKEGVFHTRPPAEVLEDMLAVRIHLDDCFKDNGALRVVPGTHLSGFVDPDTESLGWEQVLCECKAGDVLLMRPLILHASSKAVSPSHRRVIHIEFSSGLIHPMIQWFFEPGIGDNNAKSQRSYSDL